MITVFTPKGHVIRMDRQDFFAIFSGKSWWYCPRRGAMRHRLKHEGPGPKTIYFHREIMAAPSEYEVDHRNRNSLDNRRNNMRLATRGQNCQNSVKPNAGGARGVQKQRNRWVAKIQVRKKQFYLGCFLTRKEAALAYNKAALEMHGEFSVLNNIQEIE